MDMPLGVDSLPAAEDSHLVVLEHNQFVAPKDSLPVVGQGRHCMQVVVLAVAGHGAFCSFSFSSVHFHLHFQMMTMMRMISRI